MPVDFWRDVVQRVWWNIGNHKVPDGMASELIPLTPNEIQIVLKRYGVLHLAGILPWLLDSGDSGAFKFLNILNKFKELSEVSQKLLYVWKLMKESDDTGGNTGDFSSALKSLADQISLLLINAPPEVLKSTAVELHFRRCVTLKILNEISVELEQCPSASNDCVFAREAIKKMILDVAAGGNAVSANFLGHVNYLNTEVAHFVSVDDIAVLFQRYGIGTHTVDSIFVEVRAKEAGLDTAAMTPMSMADRPNQRSPPSLCWNADDEEAYQLALAEGQHIIPHGRFLLCGPGRSGKSSLERSMVGETFQKQSDSTIGMELQTAVCTIGQRDGQYVWRKETDDKMRHLIMTVKALNYVVQRKIIEARVEKAKSARALESSAVPPKTAMTPVQPDSPSVATTADGVVDQPSESVYSPPSTAAASHPGNKKEGRMTPMAVNNDILARKAVVSDPVALSKEAAAPDNAPSPTRSSMSPVSSLLSGMSTAELESELAYAAAQVERFIHELKYADPRKYDIEDLKKLVYLDIWDFAGQRLFSALQHMVLSAVRCAYAVVFDASKSLNKPTQLTICRDRQEYSLDNSMEVSNFDIMESWLNTIHEVVGDDPDVPVFVVGTHIDNIPRKRRQEALETIEETIWKCAGEKAYANNIDEVVFVDNTRAGSSKTDDTILHLRKVLIEKLKPQFNQPIPIRWIPFTIGTHELAKKYKCPWLTRDQIQRLANAVCCGPNCDEATDVEAMLKYHHNLGHVLYYPDNSRLASRVIIDVEWLLKIASLLFCPEPKGEQSKRLRKQYDLLTQNGILLESLAKHRWQQHSKQTAMYTQDEGQRDFIFDLMEKSGLLYNTKTTMKIPDRDVETRKFYVPALVTRQAEDDAIFLSDKSVPTVYLYSGRQRLLPQTLFWCAVVRGMQRYRPHHEPHLYHSAARILCYGIYWLVLEYFSSGIRIAVSADSNADTTVDSSLPESAPHDLPSMCTEALLFIEEQLEDLKQVCLRHVQVNRAVRCPCSANGQPCRRHGRKNCKQTGCHHFAELIKGQVPRCHIGTQPSVSVRHLSAHFKCIVLQDIRQNLSAGGNLDADSSLGSGSTQLPQGTSGEASHSSAVASRQEPEKCQSPDHTASPWLQDQYLLYSKNLQDSLEADAFRDNCKIIKLITSNLDRKLVAKMKCGGTQAEHNSDLIAQIMTLGHQGFAKLREIVRFMNEEVDAYEECLKQLDTIGWNPNDPKCKEYRDKLQASVH